MIGEAKVYLKDTFKIWTIDPAILAAFKPYQNYENCEGNEFVECRGRFARESAHYPVEFAHVFWRCMAIGAGKHRSGVARFACLASVAATSRSSVPGAARNGEVEPGAYGSCHREESFEIP